MTGILHFVNKTPPEWFAKKQAAAETATHGSEFAAARTCVEQLIDICNTFRCLGVPVQGHSCMFGDNESVVNSSVIKDSGLRKRHIASSFHRVRESTAAGIVRFCHMPGKRNPADVLSEHWDHSSVWKSTPQPLMFWQGDTALLHDTQEQRAHVCHFDLLFVSN